VAAVALVASSATAGPTHVAEDGQVAEYDDLRRDRAAPRGGALVRADPETFLPGDRGTVLLIHGFDSSPAMWRGQAAYLYAQGYRLLPIRWEPSRPGMTIPEVAEEVLRPAIAEALEDETLRAPLHAIGHSTGGLLLRWLVEQSPEDPLELDKLVLLSTPNAGARTGVASIACDTYKQPWREIACELKPSSATLQTLGTKVPDGVATEYLTFGVETRPNLLPAPGFDGDGDGTRHTHDNAVMAESAWLEGAEFRIWRGVRTRSHFTVACSSTVAVWIRGFLAGLPVPPQVEGRVPTDDLCRDAKFEKLRAFAPPIP